MNMIEKLRAKEHFTKHELKCLVFGDFENDEDDLIEIVETIPGEDHRWHREMTTILKCGNEYWAVLWMEGLTEMQENDFWDQPYRVKPVKRKVVVTEYEVI